MKLKNQSLLIKKCIIIFIILFLFLVFFKFFKKIHPSSINEEQKNSLFYKIDKNRLANINKYIVYGTHFNVEGTLEIIKLSGINVNYVALSLINQESSEIELKANFSLSDNILTFSSSHEINSGIDLESLNVNNYCVFLKVGYSNSDVKYYSFHNSTEHKDIVYYTLTKNNSNNKVDISFDTYNSIEYMKLSILNISTLPDNVYDVAIDPSHGGLDKGATYKGNNEAEIVLDYALKLKSKLEASGLKIFISRDGSEDSKEDTSKTLYDNNGRINLLNKSHSKILISLNLNDNNYSSKNGGVEVYAPSNCNLNFAKLIAKNIVEQSNTNYSVLNSFKKADGVYVRNFTDNDILAYKTRATKNGYTPYDITTSTPYLYIIREVGGICTNAFVDGRNTSYGKNVFFDSNIGIESYSIELGYIRNADNMNNILSNSDTYINAIYNSVISYYINN